MHLILCSPSPCRLEKEEDLVAILHLCYDSLNECGAGMIADGRLLDIIRRVHTFGLTLLKMDLRQESTRHSEVVAAICTALGIGDYLSWSEEEKCKWLVCCSIVIHFYFV
jgi:phosphoenolpyruvate carboxylase